MKYILTESQYSRLLYEIDFDSKIEKIQLDLLSKGHDLGNYGPNKDGVDGKLGPLTMKAMKKEYGSDFEEKISSPVEKTGGYDAILVGGLDNRPNDLDIDSQVSLFKQGLDSDSNVKGFRHNTSISSIIDFIKSNPGVPVYLFSAGCKYSSEISKAMGKYINKLYIIEPFGSGRNTKQSVINAVSNGVPPSNVFVGKTIGRGSGIVSGASSSQSSSHWNALKTVASITKKNN